MKFVAQVPGLVGKSPSFFLADVNASRCLAAMGLAVSGAGELPAIKLFCLARMAEKGVVDKIDLVRTSADGRLEVYEFVQTTETNRWYLARLLNALAELAKTAGPSGKVVWS